MTKLLGLPRLDHDRAFTQAVSQGDLHLARHQKRGLERCFGGQPLGDQPNTGAEQAENHHYGGAKNGDLLLAQSSCGDIGYQIGRYPAKFDFPAHLASACAPYTFVA